MGPNSGVRARQLCCLPRMEEKRRVKERGGKGRGGERGAKGRGRGGEKRGEERREKERCWVAYPEASSDIVLKARPRPRRALSSRPNFLALALGHGLRLDLESCIDNFLTSPSISRPDNYC